MGFVPFPSTMTPHDDASPHAYQVCTVEWHRPLQWLGKAWADIERCPSIGVAHGAVLALLGAALLYVSRHHFWWLAGALSSFMLVAPLLACGLYEVSRQLSQGRSPQWSDAIRVWLSGDRRLIGLGLLLGLSCVGWALSSAALVYTVMPTSIVTPEDFVRHVVLQSELGLFELWLVLGGLLAAPMFASVVIAIPLLLDRPVSLWMAIHASWRVVAHNPTAMAFWSFLLTLFTLLGIGSALIGLLGVVPLLAHASWYAYRDLVRFERGAPRA
jgi:uncharacterized membrane protein